MAEKITTEEATFSIARMSSDIFWTRDSHLSSAEIDQQAFRLRDMPVHGTEYLLDEGETCLRAVPFRWRN